MDPTPDAGPRHVVVVMARTPDLPRVTAVVGVLAAGLTAAVRVGTRLSSRTLPDAVPDRVVRDRTLAVAVTATDSVTALPDAWPVRWWLPRGGRVGRAWNAAVVDDNGTTRARDAGFEGRVEAGEAVPFGSRSPGRGQRRTRPSGRMG